LEQKPHDPSEYDPRTPESERLYPGEIDLTGALRQDAELADVIGDAIGEAEDNNNRLPSWGVRVLARALANERDDPLSGSLHTFAVTGFVRVNDALAELKDIHDNSEDLQVKEWAVWLGGTLFGLREEAEEAVQQLTSNHRPGARLASLERADRQAVGHEHPTTTTDARVMAALLAIFLTPGSEMAQFADTNDANPTAIHDELRSIAHLKDDLPMVGEWVVRLERHLASRTDLSRASPPPATESEHTTSPSGTVDHSDPRIRRALQLFGEPFQAYLQRSANDSAGNDPISDFRNAYVGSADSMAEVRTVVRKLLDPSEVADWPVGLADDAVVDWAAGLAWDIVDHDGRLYLFAKR
jgi:hypothetical protein